jgi:hypothetical protein
MHTPSRALLPAGSRARVTAGRCPLAVHRANAARPRGLPPPEDPWHLPTVAGLRVPDALLGFPDLERRHRCPPKQTRREPCSHLDDVGSLEPPVGPEGSKCGRSPGCTVASKLTASSPDIGPTHRGLPVAARSLRRPAATTRRLPEGSRHGSSVPHRGHAPEGDVLPASHPRPAPPRVGRSTADEEGLGRTPRWRVPCRRERCRTPRRRGSYIPTLREGLSFRVSSASHRRSRAPRS